jgi:hypothetical protein
MKISVASQLLFEADGEWAVAKAAEDPNALVAIIHRTHFTHVGGATLATVLQYATVIFYYIVGSSILVVNLVGHV